jgi:hypothetical protein
VHAAGSLRSVEQLERHGRYLESIRPSGLEQMGTDRSTVVDTSALMPDRSGASYRGGSRRHRSACGSASTKACCLPETVSEYRATANWTGAGGQFLHSLRVAWCLLALKCIWSRRMHRKALTERLRAFSYALERWMSQRRTRTALSWVSVARL